MLILPHDIVNNEVADAIPVEEDFNLIQDYINHNVINTDGSVAMTAPLLLPGDPTQANQAANKDYVDAVLPVGIIMPWPAPTAPTGNWLLCNGASLSLTEYPALYSVLGVRYGGSGGSFLIPNLIGRVVVGVDPARTTGERMDAVGKTGGEWAVKLKAHVHGIDHDHAVFNTSSVSGNHEHSIDHNHPAVTSAAAGAHDHDFSWVQDLPHPAGDGARIVGYVGSGLHAAVSTEPAHTHSVDVPNFDGLSGPGNLPIHLHTANVPSFTGSSGTVGTDTEQVPPYITLNYVIRSR